MADAGARERFLKKHARSGQCWLELEQVGLSVAELFTDEGRSDIALYEPGLHRDEAVLLIEELAAHGTPVSYLITDIGDDAGLGDTYNIARIGFNELTPEVVLDFVALLCDDDFYEIKNKLQARTRAEMLSLDGLIGLVYVNKYSLLTPFTQASTQAGTKFCALEWPYIADLNCFDLYEKSYKGACEPADMRQNLGHFPKLYGDLKEYSPEYIREIFTERPVVVRGGTTVHADCRSKYVNIIDGQRYTVGQPDDADCEVHIIGGCNAFGYGTDDQHTSASFLQGLVNNDHDLSTNIRCAVYNWGTWGAEGAEIGALLKRDCKRKIILYVMRGDFKYPKGRNKKVFRYLKKALQKHGGDYIDLTDTLEMAEERGGAYIDTAHVNHRGHRAVAERVFCDYLKPILEAEAAKGGRVEAQAIPDELKKQVTLLGGQTNACWLRWPDAHELVTQPLPKPTDYGYYAVQLYNHVAENSPKYLKEVLMQSAPTPKGAFVTVADGRRRTLGQPPEYDRRVFVFGDGIAFGVGADDGRTMASALQGMLNSQSERNPDAARYRVLNEGIWREGGISDEAVFESAIAPKLQSGEIGREDIVLWLHSRRHTPAEIEYLEASGIRCVDLAPTIAQGLKSGPLYVDKRHTNHRGYRMAAMKIYFDYIKGVTEAVTVSAPTPPAPAPQLPGGLNAEFNEYLAYLAREKSPTSGRVGAIVMNCNPFTNGHRYLVEQAAVEVDVLYLFVVEEDRSVFKFEDRLELVQKGVADMENVKVLGSGKFIISTITFPGYFTKDSAQSVAVDTSLDISLFIEHIVPALGIRIRFVGNEPLCPITRQYNSTMRSMLPKSGVEFKEYQRTEAEGEPISASRVRALLEEGSPESFETIRRIVPPSTYDYLRANF